MGLLKVERWDLVVVCALMATLVVFELLGVFHAKMTTITDIIKTVLPMPFRIMLWSWLGWHFIVSDIVKQIVSNRAS